MNWWQWMAVVWTALSAIMTIIVLCALSINGDIERDEE